MVIKSETENLPCEDDTLRRHHDILSDRPRPGDYAYGGRSNEVPLYRLMTAVPYPVADKLLAMAVARGMTRSALIRRIITDATGIETARFTAARPIVKLPSESPHPLPPSGPLTIVELWRRGFTAQQISALTKVAYKEVLAEIYTSDPVARDVSIRGTR